MDFKTFCEKHAILSEIKSQYETIESERDALKQELEDLKQSITKQGYDVQKVSQGVWELIKAESEQTTSGDYLNPIPYTLNMEVQENLWYTDGDNIWECIKSGTPDDFNDKEYFDIIEM